MAIGKLIICGNHVGNLLDVPKRTLDAIKTADYVVCERMFNFEEDILDFYNIEEPKNLIVDIFDGSEKSTIDKIINLLLEGNEVAFICDTGMPGFADYGVELVDLAYINNIPVQIIPGPDVIGVSLSASGIFGSGSPVIFDHYMGKSDQEIANGLLKFVGISSTLVIIDLPHRMLNLIKIASDVFGKNTKAALCSKVTSDDQMVFRMTLGEMSETLEDGDYLTFSSLVLDCK